MCSLEDIIVACVWLLRLSVGEEPNCRLGPSARSGLKGELIAAGLCSRLGLPV